MMVVGLAPGGVVTRLSTSQAQPPQRQTASPSSQFLGSKLQCVSAIRSSCQTQRLRISCDVRRSQPGDWVGGNPEVQSMLVEMIRIETGAVRVKDFVEERSDFMRDIAYQARKDYERIAVRTMKGVDAAGSKVLRRLDLGAIELEKELQQSRAEFEAQALDLEEFEALNMVAKSEGLFFKQLYQPRKKSSLYRRPAGASSVAKKIVETTSQSVQSKPTQGPAMSATQEGEGLTFSRAYKQLLYAGLSVVMVSFMWSSTSAFLAGSTIKWPKLVIYAGVFSTMLGQLLYDSKQQKSNEDRKDDAGGDVDESP